MENFPNVTVEEWLDAVASSAPAPGGGSVAATTGAMGAGLISMVCNLTVGKKKYEEVQDDIAELLNKAETLRRELTELVNADMQVYSTVMSKYKMPKATPEEKKTRAAAIQEALKEAAEVPFQIAEKCAAIFNLCMPAAEKGNQAAVSDVGVGILLADSAMHSALLNVKINMGAIKDEEYVKQCRARMEELLEGKAALKQKVMQVVEQKL